MGFLTMNSQKYSKYLKGKIILWLILFLLGIYWISHNIRKALQVQKIVQVYNNFLAGEMSVRGEDIYQLITPTREPERRNATWYCIWDVSGDEIPELHICTGREYIIYSYKNGEMDRFQAFFSSPWQYTLLESGAFLNVYEIGSISNGYYYFELDEEGEIINELRFAWMDTNENYACDEEDEFQFEGVFYTKEEWIAKTEEYIILSEDGRTEVRNPVAWTIYCEEK